MKFARAIVKYFLIANNIKQEALFYVFCVVFRRYWCVNKICSISEYIFTTYMPCFFYFKLFEILERFFLYPSKILKKKVFFFIVILVRRLLTIAEDSPQSRLKKNMLSYLPGINER